MATPTINQVQAYEPVLTNFLIGYMQADDRFLASRLFPPVAIEKDSGQYWIFTKKYFFMRSLKPRAPGGDFQYISQGVETDTFVTIQNALGFNIPDEIRDNSQIPLSLEQTFLRQVAQTSMIEKEVQFSTDFFANGVWGTTDNNATTDWDDFTASDPVNDILTARRTVSNNTGVDPNTMSMGFIVDQALRNHPDIIDRVKYTQAATQPNIESALAACFGVANYWVGKATYSNTNEAAAFSATAIIDDDCLVCQVNPGAGLFDVTAGKTFFWQAGGGMGSIYRDPPRRNHGDDFQHKEQWDQKVTAADTGYLFLDVV